MMPALKCWEGCLRDGSARIVDRTGTWRTWPVHTWIKPGGIGAAEAALLRGCAGPTLDVGCGPGRMTAELVKRGIPALGIDISELAVGMTRRRGGPALVRDVFERLPGEGRWSHVLLADGNVGIGGHPVRLLRRCATLLAADGTIELDLEPPGTGVVVELVRLKGSRGHRSEPFRWSWVGVDALLVLAAASDLAVRDIWSVAGRWQASLGMPA